MDKITDFLLSGIINQIWYILFFLIFHSLIFRVFYVFIKGSIVNKYDPLNISFIFFISPALTGFLFSPFIFSFTLSYFFILAFLLCLFALIFISRNSFGLQYLKINLRDDMPFSFQIIIVLICITVLFFHLYFNMIKPATIPLFMDDGVEMRSQATGNRFFYWSFHAFDKLPIVMIALSRFKSIRYVSFFGFLLNIAINVLFASKNAVLGFVYLELFVLFVTHARCEIDRYLWHKRLFSIFLLITLCFIPVFLVSIGYGSGSASSIILKLIVRFFAGWDQLIPSSSLDLLLHNVLPQSLIGLNLFQYQFLPFYKIASGVNPEYFSVGQYVVEAYYGSTFDSPGNYPNSNLILEAVFTSGLILGFVFFFVQIWFFYYFRAKSLISNVTAFKLLPVVFFVNDPYGLFLSGQEWISYFFVFLFYMLLAWFLHLLFSVLKSTRKSLIVA